jgi:hypothetical protein
MKQLHKLILILAMCLVMTQSFSATDGYVTVRVFDTTKFVGAGSYYVGAKIIITYETGEQEIKELLPYSEKNEPANLKSVSEVLNMLKKKGYLLMSSSTVGEQGSLVSDYVFLKQF